GYEDVFGHGRCAAGKRDDNRSARGASAVRARSMARHAAWKSTTACAAPGDRDLRRSYMDPEARWSPVGATRVAIAATGNLDNSRHAAQFPQQHGHHRQVDALRAADLREQMLVALPGNR